jgi:hypothetical protein
MQAVFLPDHFHLVCYAMAAKKKVQLSFDSLEGIFDSNQSFTVFIRNFLPIDY